MTERSRHSEVRGGGVLRGEVSHMKPSQEQLCQPKSLKFIFQNACHRGRLAGGCEQNWGHWWRDVDAGEGTSVWLEHYMPETQT